MRVIITGGGTGGHIYPALAIADKLKEMDEDTQILYVGCSEGIEKDVVPKSGYPMELVDARWLDKLGAREIAKTGYRVSKGTLESLKIMNKFKPDVVIGTGGYVCFPVLLAGHMKRKLCYLHEQNAFPGLANRTLEKFVQNVFLGFPEASAYFKEPAKHVVSGNPVRKEFFRLTKKEAREKLGLAEDDFVVFTFGGSLGSKKINEIALELLQLFNGHPQTALIMGTGRWYYQEILDELAVRDVKPAANIRIMDYVERMDLCLMACDVVISRAGALSVAETTVCGKAAILIPAPNVTANHQYYNAKSVADRGGAFLIEEKDLDVRQVTAEVMKLKNDRALLEATSRASRSCAPVGALDIICGKIREDYLALKK